MEAGGICVRDLNAPQSNFVRITSALLGTEVGPVYYVVNKAKTLKKGLMVFRPFRPKGF
jgi:hypothetical protein